ncbi:GntR family transcriptional regulator [Corynebacterium lizhenjunii]|uniref:GntR family transcriptional regulator n=1 Tax=Corynebacterium lizhenjunii TaxID=2709394 RepID=UPI0013ECDB40|nr:GntR family transcriptional regulator [Corynebacterium lizhenjunii]
MTTRREPQRYLKIADFLREEILSGRLAVGKPLPSESELCELFSTSRGPVRQAIATLRGEGRISSGRGRRSVVLGDFRAERFESTYSVYSRFQEAGIEVQQKILQVSRQPADATVAAALHCEIDTPVIYLHRQRLINGVNRVIQHHFFPYEIGRCLLEYDETTGSLHRMLTSRGVHFDNVYRLVNIEFAEPEDARALDVTEGFPLWHSEQRIHSHSSKPVEFSIFKFRADRMSISMSSVRGTRSPLQISLAEAVSS